MSPEIKLDLIKKITQTLKENFKSEHNSLTVAFGAWKSKKSAEEIIIELRNNRNFNRQIESI